MTLSPSVFLIYMPNYVAIAWFNLDEINCGTVLRNDFISLLQAQANRKTKKMGKPSTVTLSIKKFVD